MPDLFLSPSTQEYNLYYDQSGSERYYTNKIADEMEPYLVASGISFSRNDPNGTVGASVRKSNASTYKLHLAIHTNASGSAYYGKQRGSDVYYYRTSTRGKAAANIFVSNLKAIYPIPSLVRAVATTSLYELQATKAPAVLTELAYHDNASDAEWIKGNIRTIARNLALSVSEYLGVPLIDPTALRTGFVRTGGDRLNVRSKPSTSSSIVGKLQNGTEVTVTGQANGWYSIRYGSLVGYVYGKYLAVYG